MQITQRIQKKIFQFLHYPVIALHLKLKKKTLTLRYLKTDRSRLLVVPQELQASLFSETYSTRRSGHLPGGILGKLKGFMDLPMDIVFEVSFSELFSSLQKCHVCSPQCRKQHSFPDCNVSYSEGSPTTFQALEAV